MHHNQWSDFFLAISGRVRTVGLLIFWPVFCLLAIWGPKCPASSGRLSLSSSKVHGSLPMASWAHFLFDSPESLKKRLLLEVVSAMTFVSQN